jgi:hypothetical protein
MEERVVEFYLMAFYTRIRSIFVLCTGVLRPLNVSEIFELRTKSYFWTLTKLKIDVVRRRSNLTYFYEHIIVV